MVKERSKKKVLKGTYCLIIRLKEDSLVRIGKLGCIKFDKGFYVYVGSALNSLEARLERHLKNEKKLFWHVDYLLADPNAVLDEIVFAVDDRKWECGIAMAVSGEGDGIRNFGCSDCKCNSHLFRFDDVETSFITCVDAFKKLSLTPQFRMV